MRGIACIGLVVLAGPAYAERPASRVDQATFHAAGFAWRNGAWHSDCDDPGTASYTAGTIEPLGDLNSDGRREVIVSESSSYCYGKAGSGFWLLSPTPDGSWRLMLTGIGVANVLTTRGVGNWPDIAIGGLGHCFAVMRWNGQAYARHRFAYEGKRCRPRK